MTDAILLVDDDPFILQITSRLLTLIGFRSLFTASSGSEALKVWHENKSSIHTVLTDMNMPGMRGDELALELLESDPDLKIVFMSGNHPDHLDPLLPLVEGVNFLQKPFTLDGLSEMLRFPQSSEIRSKIPTPVLI